MVWRAKSSHVEIATHPAAHRGGRSRKLRLRVCCLIALGFIALLGFLAIVLRGSGGSAFKSSKRLPLAPLMGSPTSSQQQNSSSARDNNSIDALSHIPLPAHRRVLQWNFSVYLPVSDAAKRGFQLYNQRIQKRLSKNPDLHQTWGERSTVATSLMHLGETYGGVDAARGRTANNEGDLYGSLPAAKVQDAGGHLRDTACRGIPPPSGMALPLNPRQQTFVCGCLSEVPECEFFLHVGNASVALVKCCVEHFKLKTTLRNLLLSISSIRKEAGDARGLKVFLDSGTLLSSIRDGGSTLLPWETDIDLGVVGADPTILKSITVAEAATASSPTHLRASRHHFVESCSTDTSTGRCRDAHYVYFVTTKSEAKNDTSRVEIWPFHAQDGVLHHPTRAWLSIASTVVLPLGRCSLWGMRLWCPANSVAYLDHEYGGRHGWAVPRTIHWGERNVEPWR